VAAKHDRIERGTSAYRRANLALFVAGFVTFSTLYTVQPLLPLLVEEFGVTPATASLALSMTTFALAWTLPVSGTLSDALGRRGLMGGALVVSDLVSLLESWFGFRFLNLSVYPIDYLPADLRAADVMLVALGGLSLNLLAALYPAWRAARVAPAQILRYE
jgi:MFS family permease